MVIYCNFVAGNSALHDIHTIWSTAFCCCKGKPPCSSLLQKLLPLLNSGITPFTCDIFSLPNAFYSDRNQSTPHIFFLIGMGKSNAFYSGVKTVQNTYVNLVLYSFHNPQFIYWTWETSGSKATHNLSLQDQNGMLQIADDVSRHSPLIKESGHYFLLSSHVFLISVGDTNSNLIIPWVTNFILWTGTAWGPCCH